MRNEAAVLNSSAIRHSCKVCRKGFPCGRSLGGHMRSHSLAEMETALEGDAEDDCVIALGAGGYGLRENPKKTRRLDGGDESGGCGGGLDEFGHGDRGELHLHSPCAPEVGHERPPAPGVGVEVKAEREQEDAVLVPTEPAAGLMPAPRRRRRRRRRSMRVPAPAPAPAAPPAFDKEPEDVALCLITLSRDILERRGSTATRAKHSPEKDRRRRDYFHDVVDSDDASAAFRYTDVEKLSTKINKRKPDRSLAGDEKRAARYECPGCGRAFQSYQALGGHRASHKRINSNCSIAKVAPDQPEQSFETNGSFSTVSPDDYAAADIANNTAVMALKAKSPLKPMKFECPICFKVFGSGQALGGHKRSHSIAGELYERAHADGDTDAGIDEPEQLVMADGFLDLNLPAPGAED